LYLSIRDQYLMLLWKSLRWGRQCLEYAVSTVTEQPWRLLHSDDALMQTTISKQVEELETQWRFREGRWQYKLGRLRLGVEPLDEQLARYRRVTWALTAVPSLLALMFLTLFGVFGRPDIGLVFVAIILVPIVAGAWIDYALLARRAGRYVREHDEYARRKAELDAAAAESEATSGQA